MSFILDALKKAESERSRQTGPVLMDVRIAAPRRHLPAWAWVLGAVLLTNLVVLAVMFLRKPESRPQAAPLTAAPPAATVPVPVALPPATPPVTVATLPQAAAPAPIFTEAAPAAEKPAATLPFPQLPPGNAAAATAVPRAAETPLDLDNLPTAQDLLASGVTLPALQLNLNFYDPAPASRYVLMNSTRLREGDVTPDGIKVERITPRGVVLEVRGRRFLLPAGG